MLVSMIPFVSKPFRQQRDHVVWIMIRRLDNNRRQNPCSNFGKLVHLITTELLFTTRWE